MLKNPSLISASPEIIEGTPVFLGTMIPVKTILDYLKAGESQWTIFEMVSHCN